MKQILVMIAAVVLVGQSVVADEKLIADPIVEKRIRGSSTLKNPEGKLTKTDLAKVTKLYLDHTKITDESLKDVAKLQNLRHLYLKNTQITDEGLKDVAKLQKLKLLFLIDTKNTDAGLEDFDK